MENLSKRIAGLSPAKRALLELRLKESGVALITADDLGDAAQKAVKAAKSK